MTYHIRKITKEEYYAARETPLNGDPIWVGESILAFEYNRWTDAKCDLIDMKAESPRHGFASMIERNSNETIDILAK